MTIIQGLIFDFDGLLVDTETPALESWQRVYAMYGQSLSLELFQHALGTNHGFDAFVHLQTLLGRPLDRATILAQRQAIKAELSASQPLLPGVESILAQAHAFGLPCAIASSSDRAWVEGWLAHHQIREEFACVRTANDVMRTKPAPDVFLSAAACLGCIPSRCLVFEDSANGILAAQAAGMRCIVVPGAITSQLPLPTGDMRLAALNALSLQTILARLAAGN